MYQATTAVTADLPDNITLLGAGSLPKSGTSYGDTTNGVILESGVWARYRDSKRSTQSCLITGDGNFIAGDNTVEDQFEDTYTAIVPLYYGAEIPINRTSLCTWEGSIVTETYTVGAVLYYQGGGLRFVDGSNLKWNLNVFFSGVQDGGSSLGIKADPQNSPVGTYTDPVSLSVFYVNL
jgi:hypothetical protein